MFNSSYKSYNILNLKKQKYLKLVCLTSVVSTISSFNKRLYSSSKVPVVIKQRLQFIKKVFTEFMRKLLFISSIWILYIRSYFIKNNTYFFTVFIIPIITTIFILLTNLYPYLFSAFSASYFFITLGIQLIIYDIIGSKISSYITEGTDPLLSVTTLIVLSKHKNMFIRHVHIKAIVGLVIGTTPMTATGRAALIAGAFTGTAWLVNSHLDRQAANKRSQDDRTHASDESQKARDHTSSESQATREEAQKARDHASNESQQTRNEAQKARDEAQKKRDHDTWRRQHITWQDEHDRWEKQSKFTRGPEPIKPKHPSYPL